MLFNSYEFIFIFLPVTVLGFFILLPKIFGDSSKNAASDRLVRWQTAFLVAASLSFYAYWDIRYLPLLLFSIFFNYKMSCLIAAKREKKYLLAAVGINFLLLGYFKYTGFLLETLNSISGFSLADPKIMLPLGISFFTFTQTAYLIDAWRDKTHRDCGLLRYSLFVTIFPHLIAGPILYHKDMLPQFVDKRNFLFSGKNFATGLTVFAAGLFKKVMLADNIAPSVNAVFANVNLINFIEAWAGAIGYTFQLYFDFSGYSEMAIGLGLMFNFTLPVNFNSPYKAFSIIDFWRRWHMTLSAFLKNYLYIPLGGNRRGELSRVKNLFLTMLLGGLWHGAGWTFIIWGALHGIFLVINHLWRRADLVLPKIVSWPLTFSCVVVAWVFFRAATADDALRVVTTMLFPSREIILPLRVFVMFPFLGEYGFLKPGYFTVLSVGSGRVALSLCVLLGFLSIILPNSLQIIRGNFQPKKKWAIVVGLALLICILNFNAVTEFLYFQF
jgi:alginate O-acetyltransferase complex protein AlgI